MTGNKERRQYNLMAKYHAEYSCGHTRKVQLTGPQESRDRWLDKQKSILCWDCAQAAQAARELEHAAKVEADNPDLPQLTGSEAQIAWGRRVRGQALARIAEALGQPKLGPEYVVFAKRILKTRSASYWIDRRGDFGTAVDVLRYIRGRLQEESAKTAGASALGLKVG